MLYLFVNKLFNKIHKKLSVFDALYVTGFLGQIPTDIWSSIYTNWLRLSGATIGRDSVVHYKVKVWNPENIRIGRGVRIPSSTDMAGMGKITIGDYSLVGANVSFITNNHPLEDNELSWQEVLIGTQKNINIGRFCWLMNNSKIIAGRDGLIIKDYSWVAAGSIVTKNIDKQEMWGGIPAKFIRKTNIRKNEK